MTSLRLTEREVDVARHLAQGKSNKIIARELGISPHTVRDHVSVLLRKSGVDRRTRLLAVLQAGFLFGLDLLL
jgi:DNA-binding NarL/FixJ family response regulator